MLYLQCKLKNGFNVEHGDNFYQKYQWRCTKTGENEKAGQNILGITLILIYIVDSPRAFFSKYF